MQELKYIIESLLFVAEEPLPIAKLRGILETFDGKEIREALEALAEEYDQRNGGFLLREVAGGWQMRSRPDYHEWIKRMLQPSPQRLSRAALETLAVIAYKQPIIRADIEHIRGVDCGGVLRQLMERKLVRVLGRKEIAGRPLIYATTKLFLEMFDLKDLNDLPTPKEIAEFGNSADDASPEEMPDQVETDGESGDGGTTPPQVNDSDDAQDNDSPDELQQASVEEKKEEATAVETGQETPIEQTGVEPSPQPPAPVMPSPDASSESVADQEQAVSEPPQTSDREHTNQQPPSAEPYVGDTPMTEADFRPDAASGNDLKETESADTVSDADEGIREEEDDQKSLDL